MILLKRMKKRLQNCEISLNLCPRNTLYLKINISIKEILGTEFEPLISLSSEAIHILLQYLDVMRTLSSFHYHNLNVKNYDIFTHK